MVGLGDAGLGERDLIRLILQRLSIMPDLPVPFGDDVAAVPLIGGEVAVLKTDMLVGATDVPSGMSLFAAARKAVVMNISDFASKGVVPTAILVALGLPKNLANNKSILEIANGLNSGAREYGCYVVGGDTAETPDLIISISLFGTIKEGSIMQRKGTRAGDILAVTGLFGKTTAGLHLLKKGGKANQRVSKMLLDAVYNPKAHLKEGLALRGYDCVSGSMDSSDGLAWSVNELAQVNGVGFFLDRIPVAVEAGEYATENGLDALDLALYGGEEYELVLTIKPEKWQEAKRVVETVGGNLIPIGKATYEQKITYEVAGEEKTVKPKGYEHFKS